MWKRTPVFHSHCGNMSRISHCTVTGYMTDDCYIYCGIHRQHICHHVIFVQQIWIWATTMKNLPKCYIMHEKNTCGFKNTYALWRHKALHYSFGIWITMQIWHKFSILCRITLTWNMCGLFFSQPFFSSWGNLNL